MTRFLRSARRRQPSVPRSAYRQLAALRPDPARPVEPYDPCGNPPIQGGLCEGTRTAAITTAVTLMTGDQE